MPTAYNQLVNDETVCESSMETEVNRVDDYDPPKCQTAVVMTDVEPTDGDEMTIMRSVQPKDYYIPALTVTLCCWLAFPLGIAAMISSRKVRSLTENGNLMRAQEASRLTSCLIYVGLAIGSFGWSLVIAGLIIYRVTTGDTDTSSGLTTDNYAVYVQE